MRPGVAVLVALLALALGFPAPSSASVPEFDSPDASSPDSAAAPQPEPPALTIQLQPDITVTAMRVEPSSDFLRVIHADGTDEYLPNHRIRWIRDAKGRDCTDRVLNFGKSVGDRPLSIRYRVDRRSSRSLRGSPLPRQSVFPVIQAGLLLRLDQEQGRSSNDHLLSLAFDVGAIKNVTERWGAGGSLYFAGDRDFSRFGAKVRFRRWLGPAISVDAAPGLLFVVDPNRFGNKYLPGFVGELGMSFGDWVSLTGQMEAAVRGDREYGYYDPTPLFGGTYTTRRAGTEVSWYLGGKFGGEAALGATFGTLLVGVVLAGAVSAAF